jgi:uncharacterized protein (TIGR03083 family)
MHGMKPAGRIDVLHLFPDERAELLDVLRSLRQDEWAASTACAGWSVKDVAAHLIADDFGRLSRSRDGHRVSWIDAPSFDDLVAAINAQNEQWVDAMRRLSPRVVTDLLELSGVQTQAFFETLDLDAMNGRVDWIGPDPAPVWVDLAREYTERWAHQQQIRDGARRPGLYAPRLFAPVLDAYMRGVPRAYAGVDAPEGTQVLVEITGDAGGRWSVVRRAGAWGLYVGGGARSAATVTLDQETAWRLFTKGITPVVARSRAAISDDVSLGERVLDAVSVLA